MLRQGWCEGGEIVVRLSVGTEAMSAKEKHHKGGEKLKTQKR